MLQCALPPGTHVQVNDHPPWFGQVVSFASGNYQIRVGGTGTLRQIPEDRVVLHPSVLAQRVAVPVVRPPSRFEIGAHVQVNDTPPWFGQIVDWKGKGIYRVRFGGSNLVKEVPESRLDLHPAFAAMKKVQTPAFHPGTHVQIDRDRPLFGQVTGWNGKSSRYEVRIGGTERTIEVDAGRVDFHSAIRARVAPLRNATYIPFSQACNLSAATTLVMRAQNTGDMYHVKASMAIHPEYCLLLWNVNGETRGQAQQVIDLLSDLLGRPGSRQRVYYTEKNHFPGHLRKTETTATEEIEKFFRDALNLTQTVRGGLQNERARRLNAGMMEKLDLVLKSVADTYKHSPLLKQWVLEYHRRLAIEDLSRRYAFYSEEEGRRFERDLTERGHFRKGCKYVIVNFRATGHSDRQGANAPALDTGLAGVEQIIAAVQEALGGSVIPVPMGEEPRSMSGGANLLNYWEWPSARDRRQQAALIKYLNDHYDVLGVVGMRSGVIDQMVFSGLKVISIDISPHRYDERLGLPDLGVSKGWSRGLKLESVFRESYGRVFLRHHREHEMTRKLAAWRGEFHPRDVAAIRESIAFYLSGSARGEYQDSSHPMHPREVEMALARFSQLLAGSFSGYDMINHLHPYIAEVSSLLGSFKDLQGQAKKLLKRVDDAIADLERMAASEIQSRLGVHTPRKIKWMRDNLKEALLKDLTGHMYYQEQKAWAAKNFGVGDEDQAAAIYGSYYKHYSSKVKIP